MARTRTETHSIQTWPGGEGYTYRGDPYGPPARRALRVTQYNGADQLAWRKGTAAEWRTIRIALRAEGYQRHEVLCCDSALVDALIKLGADEREELAKAFGVDEIRNLYADPSDWGLEQCRDYLREYGADEPTEGNVWQMDRDDLIEQLTSASIETRDEETIDTLRAAVIVNIDDETLPGIADWRAACRDLAQDNPAEPYEWWRVSQWLCDELHAIGRVTIDNGYGCWWGRTTTGQGLIMDGVLQQVAARQEREED